jgi:2-dehydro-3-deoxyphosphogluconate aldolase/(4S)-4-hydroxy-2-oxoglutarate aldolase
MNREKKILKLIADQKFLPAYFHPNAEVSINILKAFYNAGFRAVEYIHRNEVALDNFLQLQRSVDTELQGMKLGAGSIKSTVDATEFMNEGAEFIVCPGIVNNVASLVHNNELLWIPTCLTSSEILKAEELGAKMVRLFPSGSFGTSFLRSIKETFPDLHFMPAGIPESEEVDISAWFKAGASVLEIGSQLIASDLMETRNFAAIESNAQEWLRVSLL